MKLTYIGYCDVSKLTDYGTGPNEAVIGATITPETTFNGVRAQISTDLMRQRVSGGLDLKAPDSVVRQFCDNAQELIAGQMPGDILAAIVGMSKRLTPVERSLYCAWFKLEWAEQPAEAL